MTKEELKTKLIEANKTRQTPRTDTEIDAIISKFEKSLETRDNMIVAGKSDRAKINEIIKDFDPADCRLYACNDMGIFVHRNGDKATVTFSFLNPADEVADVIDIRSFKLHALLNFKLNKYTYTVDWKGRSEFAVYDAFVANHDSFPGFYKNLSIAVKVGMYSSDGDCGWWDSLHQ